MQRRAALPRPGPAAAARCHIGVDENGLGPRLGPLVVTAVLARATAAGAVLLGQPPSGALAKRLGDSKALVGHGHVALGEAWTRTLVARGAGKHRDGSSPDALLDALTLDDREVLRAPCPQRAASQCWSRCGEQLSATERMAALLAQLRADLESLERGGVQVLAVRSAILCTARLNQAAGRGDSRLLVDLHAMERLLLALGSHAGEPVEAVCGKVGGYQAYGPAFGPLGGFARTTLTEGRALSAYRFAGLGDVAFARHAEADHLLVAMASLVGKYLRELLMARVARYYQRLDSRLLLVSGYGDKRSAAFITSADPLRQRQAIPIDCFERRGAEAARSTRR